MHRSRADTVANANLNSDMPENSLPSFSHQISNKKVANQAALRMISLETTRSNPTIRAPPHKNHDEHRQCNPGGGGHFAVILGSDNSYTTPLRNPFF